MSDKSSESKAMWTFLNSILELLKKINWPYIWSELVKIPKGIKNLLLISLIVGVIYFAYTRFYTHTNLNNIQEQVNDLNKKVENVLSTQEYDVDVKYIIATLYLLEELNEQQYQISKSQSIVLINHMKTVNCYDPNIREIEMSLDRLEQQHLALKRHFRLSILKFNPDGDITPDWQ